MQRSQTRELAPVPHFPYFTIAVTFPQCGRYCHHRVLWLRSCVCCSFNWWLIKILWLSVCRCSVPLLEKPVCPCAEGRCRVCPRSRGVLWTTTVLQYAWTLTTKQDSSPGGQRVISPAHDGVTQCYISLRHRGHWQPLQPQLSTSIRATSRGAPAPVTVTLILRTWPTL